MSPLYLHRLDRTSISADLLFRAPAHSLDLSNFQGDQTRSQKARIQSLGNFSSVADFEKEIEELREAREEEPRDEV